MGFTAPKKREALVEAQGNEELYYEAKHAMDKAFMQMPIPVDGNVSLLPEAFNYWHSTKKKSKIPTSVLKSQIKTDEQQQQLVTSKASDNNSSIRNLNIDPLPTNIQPVNVISQPSPSPVDL